ncbi:hypothetical protein QQ045_000923 [Rhodiola kirilowii]
MQLELVAFVRCPDLIGSGGLFMKNQNQCLFALSHFNHLVWSGSDIHCCKDVIPFCALMLSFSLCFHFDWYDGLVYALVCACFDDLTFLRVLVVGRFTAGKGRSFWCKLRDS